MVDLPLETDVSFPDPPAWFCLRRENWVALLEEVEAEFEERVEAVCPRPAFLAAVGPPDFPRAAAR